jgi:hypothetical protein
MAYNQTYVTYVIYRVVQNSGLALNASNVDTNWKVHKAIVVLFIMYIWGAK